MYENHVWNLHKFGTSPWYGTTINLVLSKLCKKNPTRNVVDWYEMGVRVYFDLVLVWKEILMKMAQNFPFLLCPTPLRPRGRALPRWRLLRLGGPEIGFL